MTNTYLLYLLILLLFIGKTLCSQPIKLIKYNVESKKIDTISILNNFDNNNTYNSTLFSKGQNDLSTAILDEQFPTENLSGDNNFTNKFKADSLYQNSDFPIRTTVRLNYLENDTIFPLCSGNIVSPKYVLTAKHCIKPFNNGSNFFNKSDYFISPVYNNSEENPHFNNTRIKNIYVPFINGREPDIALLELNEPLGLITGWIGIGYEEDNTKLENKTFYKFSYPGMSNFLGNGLSYNADTLYSSFGQLNYFTDSKIGIKRHKKGIPGESGSSLFSVQNNEEYISYGVFSLAANYEHTRITRSIYQAFTHLLSNKYDEPKPLELSIYPNPATKTIYLFNILKSDLLEYKIYNIRGSLLQSSKIYNALDGISCEALPEGIYIISCLLKSGNKQLKFIKIKD